MKVEIIHDSLAKRVYSLIDAEDRMWLKIEQFIQNRYQYFLESQTYLTAKDLEYIAPYLDQLKLNQEQEAFINASKESAKKKSLAKRITYISIIAILAITAIVTVWAYEENARTQEVVRHADEVKEHALSSNLAAKGIQSSAFDQTLAYKLAKLAVKVDPKNLASINIENSLLFRSVDYPFYYRVIEGHEAPIVDLAISTYHDKLLSADTDGWVKLHDMQGNLLYQFRAHNSRVNDVDFVSYHKRTHILTASNDGTVVLWDSTGQKLCSMDHGAPVNDVSMAKGERFILSAGHDGKTRKWKINPNINFLKTEYQFQSNDIDTLHPEVDILHEDEITSIDLLKDQRHIISSDIHGQIKITDLDANITRLEISNHDNPVTNMDYDGDHGLLAAGFEDGTLKLWKVYLSRDTAYVQLKIFFKAHEKAIKDLVLDHAGEKVLILTSSEDNRAILWDENGNKLKTLLGHKKGLTAIDLSIKGSEWTVLSGGKDLSMKLWSIEPYERSSFNHANSLNKILADAEGNTISALGPNILALRDSNNDVKYRFDHGENILSFAFNQDESELVIGGHSGLLTFWDKRGKSQQFLTVSPELRPVNQLAYSPNGKYLLIGTREQLAMINRSDGEIIFKVEAHRADITQALFAPKSKFILTSSQDSTIKLWNYKGEHIRTYKEHIASVNTIAFFPNGKEFVSGCSDNELKRWHIDQDTSLHTFIGHSDAINKVKISRDGTKILSASDDHSVWLWSIDGRPMPSVISHHQPVIDVSFSQDGNQVISQGSDAIVKFWDLNRIEQFLKKIEDFEDQKEKFYRHSAGQELKASSFFK